MSVPVRWTEVRVVAPVEWLELVAGALAIGPCTSAAFGRPSLGTEAAPEGFDHVRVFIPDHADSRELRAGIERAISGLAQASGAPELEGLVAEFRPLPPEDYATSWKKSWKPFRVGRLCVLAPWSRARPRPGERVLELEPGGAFGSGRHATTRACLRAIEERMRRGAVVLDAGSGSGILAVASVVWGASRALGFDTDPNATPYARALAEANRASDRAEFRTGGIEVVGAQDGTFDVVLANIYADVIREHAARLRDLLRPDGWFAFSGCSSAHAAATAETISGCGFVVEEERVRGRWHTFLGTRGD